MLQDRHSFPDSRILASSSFAHAERDAESWRVLKVKQYINDHYAGNLRLGSAARLLVDTTQSISEICYSCGFNNLSNFNRIFKAKRGYTPRDFRALFKKTCVFV